MKVEIRTKMEGDKPSVAINASEALYHPNHFDDRIAALKAAQAWLKTELARK